MHTTNYVPVREEMVRTMSMNRDLLVQQHPPEPTPIRAYSSADSTSIAHENNSPSSTPQSLTSPSVPIIPLFALGHSSFEPPDVQFDSVPTMEESGIFALVEQLQRRGQRMRINDTFIQDELKRCSSKDEYDTLYNAYKMARDEERRAFEIREIKNLSTFLDDIELLQSEMKKSWNEQYRREHDIVFAEYVDETDLFDTINGRLKDKNDTRDISFVEYLRLHENQETLEFVEEFCSKSTPKFEYETHRKDPGTTFRDVYFEGNGRCAELNDYISIRYSFESFRNLYSGLNTIIHCLPTQRIRSYKNFFDSRTCNLYGWRSVVLVVEVLDGFPELAVQIELCLKPFEQEFGRCRELNQQRKMFRLEGRTDEYNAVDDYVRYLNASKQEEHYVGWQWRNEETKQWVHFDPFLSAVIEGLPEGKKHEFSRHSHEYIVEKDSPVCGKQWMSSRSESKTPLRKLPLDFRGELKKEIIPITKAVSHKICIRTGHGTKNRDYHLKEKSLLQDYLREHNVESTECDYLEGFDEKEDKDRVFVVAKLPSEEVAQQVVNHLKDFCDISFVRNSPSTPAPPPPRESQRSHRPIFSVKSQEMELKDDGVTPGRATEDEETKELCPHLMQHLVKNRIRGPDLLSWEKRKQICHDYSLMMDHYEDENAFAHITAYSHGTNKDCRFGRSCYTFQRKLDGNPNRNDKVHLSVYRHP